MAITTFIYPIEYNALSMLKLWPRAWSPSKLTNRTNGFEPIVYLTEESLQGEVILIKKKTMVIKHTKTKHVTSNIRGTYW